MSDASTHSPTFSFAQARRLIGDLNSPKPWIYWTDFLTSILIGHIAIHGILFIPRRFPDTAWAWGGSAVCYVITVLAYMRALMFIHELVHLPKRGFGAFRFVWNALCGILFLVPSFLYYPHVDHHRRKHYGTDHDGEYLALSHMGRWMIVGFVVQALLVPFLGIARFLIISPVCWVIPGARQWVHRHASTMLVDPSYERTDAGPELMRTVVIQEFFCFLWCIVLLSRHYFRTGIWFDPFWIVAYGVGIGLLVLNEIRTLGAHRWTNEEGEMTFEEQLLDTVNYPHKPWISELWGPIGTRYHALHHLFPRMPYHNLAKAHQRLVQGLPADSPYHRTIATSLTSEIVALWHRARESERRPSFAETVNKTPDRR
ncbi:Fatty acid desaturase [Rubripirellula tenax]|uniref:Fatty acid desaturase n=1 Tax=Rubripirellula tenax TaxID=2528015 RepID=A0A5C6FGS0_9BACT|nr:fatty acid desaturase [Rubripirellula tenax]TWU58771.1 Fatty acid desaturase [Rubripirellula tenax]